MGVIYLHYVPEINSYSQNELLRNQILPSKSQNSKFQIHLSRSIFVDLIVRKKYLVHSYVNPLQPGVAFLYPLKTSKCFQGV